MEENEKEIETTGVPRRKFLKDAGLVIGGAAVGSIAVLSSCKGVVGLETALPPFSGKKR